MKRESGLNPEQPPLLYLTKEEYEPLEFSEKVILFAAEAVNHKSGYLPCLFRFYTTLVRRVQPIYQMPIIGFVGCTLFLCVFQTRCCAVDN